MSRIYSTIQVDFETGDDITEDQFHKFESKLRSAAEDWELVVYEIAEECGFEADEIHPLIIDDIDCDF